MPISAQPSPAVADMSRAGLHAVAYAPPAKSAAQDANPAALDMIGTVVRYARNATIFSDGDDAAFSYQVVSGTVRLCKLMSDGRRQIAEFVEATDFFGIEWLPAHSLTAEALTDAVVIRYARKHLDRIGRDSSTVQAKMMAVLSRELWAAKTHIVRLGRQTARERVVSFILALAERHGVRNGQTLDVPMSRQDIADYLGLTIETVCRAISALKRQKIIGVPNRTQLVLCNIEKLHEIADSGLQAPLACSNPI